MIKISGKLLRVFPRSLSGMPAPACFVSQQFLGAAFELLRVIVAELMFDVLAVRFNGFAADPELDRNLARPSASGDRGKHGQFTVAQRLQSAWQVTAPGKSLYRQGNDCRAGIDFA